MMEYMEQIDLIIKANHLDFQKVVYPAVIESEYDPVDKVDILAVIKDIDIAKYNFMDTLARDYVIDICSKLIVDNGNC